MKTVSQDQAASFKEFEVLFRNAVGRQITTSDFIFGFIGIGMFVSFLDMFIGFVFAGLYLGLGIIAPVYDPVYQLFRKIHHLQNVPLHIVKPPLWRFLIACLSLTIPGYLIFIGIHSMASFEFCAQSFTCILIDLIR